MIDYKITVPLHCPSCDMALGIRVITDDGMRFQYVTGGDLIEHGEITCGKCRNVVVFNPKEDE